MDPVEFFRGHGLIIDSPLNDGRWHRVPTEDHPRKKNGAYKIDGDFAACINHATMTEGAVMRGERVEPVTEAEKAAMRERAKARQATQEQDWRRAAERAQKLLNEARPAQSGYLVRKGLDGEQGLVLADGTLVVPMRHIRTNELVGAQTIKWDQEAMVWDKKFLPGMRSRLAVLRMGPGGPRDTILCEGLATGISLMYAVRSLKLDMGVMVCFSAGNVTSVAEELKGSPGKRLVFADHDPPQRDPLKWEKNQGQAGQRAAVATGLPWTMSPREGEDANDLWRREGVRALAAIVMNLRRMSAPPDWKPAPPPEGAQT